MSTSQRDNNTITLSLAGHSTVLINMYGKWIITDPVLFDKIGIKIGKWKVGMSRIVPSALHIDDIHSLDYIVLSHAHMDHWDTETLDILINKFPDQLHIICPKNTKKLLSHHTHLKSITEVERGEEEMVDGLLVRAGETNHWGARRPWETRKYKKGHRKAQGHNSFLLSYKGKNIVFGGDTAYTDAYKELTNSADIAIMPIGSYDPWIDYHCNPEQAVSMAEHMGAKRFVPIHFETFRLDKAHLKQPMERLKKALTHHPLMKLAIDTLGGKFTYPEVGS